MTVQATTTPKKQDLNGVVTFMPTKIGGQPGVTSVGLSTGYAHPEVAMVIKAKDDPKHDYRQDILDMTVLLNQIVECLVLNQELFKGGDILPKGEVYVFNAEKDSEFAVMFVPYLLNADMSIDVQERLMLVGVPLAVDAIDDAKADNVPVTRVFE